MKKILKNFLAISAIIIISFVVLESALRLLRIVPMYVVNESIYPDVLGDHKPSQKLLSDYILPHRININSLGLRGKEIAVKKAEGVYRILVLGDSFVFGERVDDEQCFPFQLEKLFNEASDGKSKIEVINAGHSAYATREEYEYFLERGLRLSPDMVILAWFTNDIKELSREYSWRDLLKEHYKFEPFKSCIRSFATFNALRYIITDNFTKLRFGRFVPKEEINIFDEKETDAEKILWDKCFSYILKIKSTCDNNNIRFLFLIFPDYSQFKDNLGFRPQLRLKNFAQKNQIDFIDFADKFKAGGRVSNYYLLPKDPHFSAAGNALVAKEVYLFLRKTYLSDILPLIKMEE